MTGLYNSVVWLELHGGRFNGHGFKYEISKLNFSVHQNIEVISKIVFNGFGLMLLKCFHVQGQYT